MLGFLTDFKLNLNLHISNICRSAANQLTTSIRLNQFLSFEETRTNFDHCPLVWMLSRLVEEKYKFNLSIRKHFQVTFGTKSLGVFGLKVWNSSPYHIKSFENLDSLRVIIKYWNGTRCNCKTI